MFLPRLLFSLILIGLAATAWAQPYISTCETVPYACPTVCAGGSITVKIFQIQRLPSGSQLQAQLSDANGTYGPGSQILPVAAYSTNGGNTYTPGPYTFRQDVTDLLARFQIPAGTQPGSRYTLRIRSSSGYASADNFRCPGNGTITITAGGATLPMVPQNQYGQNQWIGHVYTWNPTTSNPLTTDDLVNAQTFFDTSRYQGHVVYNDLDIDKTFSTTGGIPGSITDGTSIGCGTSFNTNFSMRLRRRQTFAAGYYRFTLGGDDGVRLSIDGGRTWVLSSFYDQLFTNSIRTTAAQYPNGVCLNGEKDLVIEYYQHPQDAQLLFKVERLSPDPIQPQDQTVCGSDTASFYFGVLGPRGNLDPTNAYQWQLSLDGGQRFSNLAEGGNFTGTRLSTLSVFTGDSALDGIVFRCVVTNPCLGEIVSDKAILHLNPGPRLLQQPSDTTVCMGNPARFRVWAEGAIRFQWQIDAGDGFQDITLPGFEDVQTPSLTVDSGRLGNSWRFRCLVTGDANCPQTLESAIATLEVLPCCKNTDLGNVITPNGDGLNEAFGRLDCPLQDFEMKVYNRWGKRVFQTKSPLQGWDAKGEGAGVYFYRMQYQAENGRGKTERKGTVEVVR